MPESDSAPEARQLWQVSVAGCLYGPLDTAALQSMAREGRLTRVTLVCAVGASDWRLVSTVPELAGLPFAASAGSGQPSPALPRPRWAALAFGAVVLLLVGGYWAWQFGWIGLDLWPWYKPVLSGRRVLSEKWLPLPQIRGLFLIDRGELREFSPAAPPPHVGPEVEFIQHGEPDKLIRQTVFLQQGWDPHVSDGPEDAGCILWPIKGRSDIMRLIPTQVLTPGKYQLSGVGTFFVEYETYRQHLREALDTDWKNRRWLEGINCGAQWLDAAGGKPSQTESLRREWSRRLLDNIAEEPDRPTTVTRDMLAACCSWSPELKKDAAERTLKLVRDLVRNPGGIKNAIPLVKFSEKISSSTAAQYGELGWEELSRRLADPSKLGREDFALFFDMCQVYGFPEAAKTDPAYQLAQALLAYTRGERAQAFSALKELAEAATETTATRVARQILAQPPAGKIEIQRPPIVFKDSSHRDALKIEIKALQVGTHELEVDLVVSNLSTRRQLLSYAENGSEPGAAKVGELLSITDDIGQKRESLYGLGGGKLVAEARGNMRAVQLEPGESPEVSVRFPLPSPGATRFSFAVPRYRNQSAWGWQDLPLKAGPFDAPLAVLPLSNAALQKPQEAPSAAQAAKPAEAAPSPASPASNSNPKDTRPGSSDKKTKSTALQPPTPASTEAPAANAPTPPPPAEQGDKTPAAQRGQAPTVQKTPAPVDRAQAQAAALRRDAQQARQRSQSRLGRSPLKINLFASAEAQRQAAEQAYSAANYTKAALYFQQAILIYKRVAN